MTEVTVWVVVDEDGSYVAHEDKDLAAERYAEDVGGDATCAKRVVKLVVKVPTPKPLELVGTATAEPEGGELKVA